MITSKPFSFEQEFVLAHIYRRHLSVINGERLHSEDGVWRDEVWVAWQPNHDRTGQYTRSLSASLSRTLRRLEQRGLVERRNTMSGSKNRTTAVRLTPEALRMVASWAEQNERQDTSSLPPAVRSVASATEHTITDGDALDERLER